MFVPDRRRPGAAYPANRTAHDVLHASDVLVTNAERNASLFDGSTSIRMIPADVRSALCLRISLRPYIRFESCAQCNVTSCLRGFSSARGARFGPRLHSPPTVTLRAINLTVVPTAESMVPSISRTGFEQHGYLSLHRTHTACLAPLLLLHSIPPGAEKPNARPAHAPLPYSAAYQRFGMYPWQNHSGHVWYSATPQR